MECVSAHGGVQYRVVNAQDHFLCRFGSGFGPIYLDEVDCTGSESCLLSCSNNGIGFHDCSHFEDVAIFCSGSRSPSTNCNSKLSYVLLHVRTFSIVPLSSIYTIWDITGD